MSWKTMRQYTQLPLLISLSLISSIEEYHQLHLSHRFCFHQDSLLFHDQSVHSDNMSDLYVGPYLGHYLILIWTSSG